MKSAFRYPKISNSFNRLLFVLAILFMSANSYADSAQAESTEAHTLFKEAELAEKYESVIKPFWDNKVQLGEFFGVADIKIHTAFVIHPNSKGSIVISSGRTEGSIKYKEVFYDLYQHGYSVFTLDHRGQGQSGRMAENTDKGHVEDYADFVRDLHSFVQASVLPNSKEKPVLLCHSMGCAIGANYLITHPDHFAKVVFASPMFGFNAPIPEWVANTIMATHGFFNWIFSDEPWYFPGQGDAGEESFEGNVVSQSQVRFKISQDEFKQHDVALGGITTGWLKASLIAIQRIKDEGHKITIPALLMQAGSDVVVSNDAQNEVCQRLPNCEFKVIPGAQHELMMEADEYRVPTMEALLAFLNKD